jgi:HME family heavy-metal exporter
MFTTLVASSLRQRALVLLIAAAMMVYGAITLGALPVDVLPDLNRPVVTIMSEAPGLAPEEVEQRVSLPIETSVAGLPGVVSVRSTAAIGLSVIYVDFDWGTDVFRNRQLVAERLGTMTGQLPEGVTPTMASISSIMGEIMLVGYSWQGIDPMVARDTADWVVRPRLLAIPGVSQVISIGGAVRELRITPDPSRMALEEVTINSLSAALDRFATPASGGFLERDGQELLVRAPSGAITPAILADIPIQTTRGISVRLGSVAQIAYAAKVKRGDASMDAAPAVILSVQKQPGADSISLTHAVEAALAELAPAMPAGLSPPKVLFRQADFIQASLGNVRNALIEAGVVVALILFAFLVNMRPTVISLTAIPLSLLITIGLFQVLGLTINTMTLGGLAIAIGELVDDALVDVENVFRRLRENAAFGSPRTDLAVVLAASVEVRSGIVYATMIVVLVFMPLFALSGIEGRLFQPLGIAYITAILMSLLTAMTVTPVMALLLLPSLARQRERDGFVMARLKAINERLLTAAFSRPRPVFLAIIAAVIIALIIIPFMPRVFLPPFNEGTLTIGIQLNPGVALSDANEIGTIAEQLMLNVPGVISTGRRTGRAEMDEHAQGVYAGEIDVILEPGISQDKIVDAIRFNLAMLPIDVNVGQPISHRLDHLLSGVRAPIALKIYGDDLAILNQLAAGFQKKLAAMPGLADVQIEKQVSMAQLRIDVEPSLAARFGISPAQIRQQVERMMAGVVIARVTEGSRRMDALVRLSDGDRTIETIGRLPIETPEGLVPLATIAKVVHDEGPNQILREQGRRRLVLFANTAPGAPISSIVAEIKAELAKVQLPRGYNAQLEGTFRAEESASRRLILLAAVSLGLIFFVLLSRYQSAVLALMILSNVPLALIGSVVALWLANLPLSVAATIGFITLTGIVTRNGILKVSHYINLVLHEGESFGIPMIMRGSQERLAPVLMTALSAGLALLPLVFGADRPGTEILHPVAVTILGGLVTSTAIDAFLTPILFYRFGAPALERLRQSAAITGRPAESF